MQSKINEHLHFPLEVLPEVMREIIQSMQESMGYPTDYLAASMLVATATAMGNNWTLSVKNNWRERALIYLAIVGNAGANKTHPMSFALKPLVDIDLERIASAEESQEEYTPPPRLVVSDVTQEGLVKLHHKNPRGLVLFIDELKAWVANFSRYSGGSQEQFWLSNFSRTPIIVDRKSDPKPLSIPEPMISVIGSTQPSVLRQFAAGDKSSNGFVDRLLFVIKTAADKPYWSDTDADPNIAKSWSYLLRKIATDPLLYNVVFDSEAMAYASQWQAFNVDKINGCKSDRLVGAYSKLEIYFVRFCLILHALRYHTILDVDPSVITLQTAQNAAKLAEYFRAEVEVAQEYLYPDVEAELAEKPLQLYRALPETFSYTEAVVAGKSIGISRSSITRHLKQLGESYIDKNEEGNYYKL